MACGLGGRAGAAGPTFTLSMQASIFSCSTAFRAWEMLVVLLLDTPSFILRPWNSERRHRGAAAPEARLSPPCPPLQHPQRLHPAGARGSTSPFPQGEGVRPRPPEGPRFCLERLSPPGEGGQEVTEAPGQSAAPAAAAVSCLSSPYSAFLGISHFPTHLPIHSSSSS